MHDLRTSLCCFNHFLLQLAHKNLLHERLQGVVWYAESRLRQALIKISQADQQSQTWMQHILADEVVGVLKFNH